MTITIDRKGFEAWVRRHFKYPNLDIDPRYPGFYADKVTAGAWEAWKESRAHLSQPQPVAQGEAVAWAVFNDKSGKIDGDPSCYRSSLDEDRLLAGFSVRPLYARDTHPSRVKEVECPSCAGSGASDLHPCISCKHCDGCGWVADTTPTTPTGHRVVPVEVKTMAEALQKIIHVTEWANDRPESDICTIEHIAREGLTPYLAAAPDAGGV